MKKLYEYLVQDINKAEEDISATKSNYLFVFASDLMNYRLFWMSKKSLEEYKEDLELINDSENHGKNLYQTAQQKIEKGAEYIMIYYNISKDAWLIRGQNSSESRGRTQLNKMLSYGYKNIKYFKSVNWDTWLEYISK